MGHTALLVQSTRSTGLASTQDARRAFAPRHQDTCGRWETAALNASLARQQQALRSDATALRAPDVPRAAPPRQFRRY